MLNLVSPWDGKSMLSREMEILIKQPDLQMFED